MQSIDSSRRRFLRAAGVAIGLPLLNSFSGVAKANNNGTDSIGSGTQDPDSPPRRLVFICTSLGLHAPNLFPTETGLDYKPSKYLSQLEDHRGDFTLYAGLSHPDQNGSDGHSGEKTWLTSAPNPGLAGFRNSISVDLLAAEKLGYATRFPSLILGTEHSSQAYTRSGVMVPAENSPAKLYEKLFVQGSQKQRAKTVSDLSEGRSILDTVSADARRLAKNCNAEDRHRLGEYFQSVRDAESRLQAAQSWVGRPKPQVELEKPSDIQDDNDLIGRTELMFQLIPLALQTDSTRVISMLMQGGGKPPIDGVQAEHHSLSHHGKEPDKIAQLERIELAQFQALNQLLAALSRKGENGVRLLDSTSLVFGSNLGNANSHDWRNLPILLAGGGMKHRGYHAFDKENNKPLSNLFLSMLQYQGHEIEKFGSSTSTLL